MEYIFRAYDVRGLFNKELTADMATKIGMAFGTYLKGKGKVLLGMDSRTSSRVVENALCAGIASTGVDVYTTGLVPIPTSNFKTARGKFDAGTYITASHNPPEYNGIRFRHPDGSGFTYQNEEIRDIFLKGEFILADWDKLGEIIKINPEETLKEYCDYLISKIRLEKPLKVILDSGNGASTLVAPYLFRKLGARVSTLNANPDGTFPGRPSEPNDKNLSDLKNAVKTMGADFGVGYDGDGDRCVFVDDKGRTVQTEKIGLIIVKEILKKKKGNIVANVECSMILEELIPPLGGVVKRVRVGDVFVCESIKEFDALFAMETSAHYFYPEFYIFDDPIVISLKLAEILSRGDRKLSEIVDEIPSYPKIAEKFQCPDEIKFQVMDEIIEDFKSGDYDLNLIDGARVQFDDGWILLRPSNTTPLIRCTIEAQNQSRIDELYSLAKDAFEKAKKKIGD